MILDICFVKIRKQCDRNVQQEMALFQRYADKLIAKGNVKKKRKKLNVAASIGRIFEKYKIGKFFSWDIGDNGEVNIVAEGGCY